MTSSAFDEILEGLPVRVVDVFNVWSTLFIARTIPLGRLEWIWNSRGASLRESSLSAKAVFELTDSLKAPESPPPERAFQWYRKPYFHLYLIPITELDSPRDSSGWARVRQFVDSCREKSQEYIVAVIASDAVARQQRKLLERLRAEVNISVRGRERVVTVPAATIAEDQKPVTHLYNSPSHQDLLIRLRECSRGGVEARVQKYENELARLYTNRAGGSWSFCYFFLVKEAMGFVFCQLGRRDIALRLLDELHTFMVESDEKEGARVFCKETPCAAAANATNVNGKDYHKLFMDESITEMEMRTYLFARQTEIMLPDRKFADIAERGLKLITAVSRRCIEESAKDRSPASSCFRDAWVFTASRALASTLAPAIPSTIPDTTSLTPQLSTPKERHTARLIAGFHVHALKAFLGLAKMVLPGALAPQKENEKSIADDARKELLESFNDELRDALSTPNNAEILYSEIANAAASLYEMGGRSRGAAALDGDAGVIRLRNGSLSEAEKLLNAQCSRFSDDHSWDDLHKRKRKELARAEKQLDKVQEYLVSCLTMLFMTREARSINLVQRSSSTHFEAEKSHAAMWSKEAYESAAKLPRVMKYKAEKLVNVSVRPNTRNWCEGDPAEAVVVIQSDIPADLRFDSLFVELKSAFTANGEKKVPSALHREKPESPSTSRSTSLTLKSRSGTIAVKPGINEVPVYMSELPWSGRYNISLVALFMGKLKLVQVAPKLETSATVSMRGSSSTSATPPTDLGKAAVRFPCFYAKSRAAPASVTVQQDDPIYLVQDSVQVVQVDVKSEIYGISKGASLCVSLDFEKENGTDEKILEFIDIVRPRCKERDSEALMSPVSFHSKTSENRQVEAIIGENIAAGSSLTARLSLQVPKRMCSPALNQKIGNDKCILRAELVGCEESSPSKRGFKCSTEGSISLLNPVSVYARSDLNTGSSEIVPAPHGLDDLEVAEGGTLVCTLQSNVVGKRSITLQSASLDLPHWLQLCKGEDPPHADLLPCAVNHGCRFLFAFDIDVCANLSSPESRRGSFSLSNITESLSHRRFGRRSRSSADNDDNLEQELDNKHHDPNLRSRPSGDPKTARQNPEASMDLEGISSPGDDEMTIDVEMEDAAEPMETTDTVQSRSKSPDGRELGDVVDLSSGVSGNIADAKSPDATFAFSEQDSFATLRVEFSIDGVEGATRVDRLISMNAFRPQSRLYRIERVCPEKIYAGQAVELSFCISAARNRNLTEEETGQDEVLQYEIEADPRHWVVAGRKRGRITVSGGTSDVGTAKILPLVTGRVVVPTTRLYSESGSAIPMNSCETLNECMQVVVLPCANVTTVCKQRKTNALDGLLFGGQLNGLHTGLLKPKAHMPAVVTFDSFFDS